MLTVDFINSLGITAEKIDVGDTFSADAGTGLVTLGGFTVGTKSIYSSSATGQDVALELSKTKGIILRSGIDFVGGAGNDGSGAAAIKLESKWTSGDKELEDSLNLLPQQLHLYTTYASAAGGIDGTKRLDGRYLYSFGTVNNHGLKLYSDWWEEVSPNNYNQYGCDFRIAYVPKDNKYIVGPY
jgi:hypothetical protein